MIDKLKTLPALMFISLAGCTAIPFVGSGGLSAPTPEYRIGDRWVYQAEDGFRVKDRWVETHEVTAVSQAGITMRITQKGNGIDGVRFENWVAPGQVSTGALCGSETRYFDAPLERFNFPLTPGHTWNQWVGNTNAIATATRHRKVNHYVRVSGWDKVTTSAGTFDAIKLNVIMHLDDAEFWHWPTTCNYTIWYAPAVRNVLREKREAEYLIEGESGTVRTQHAVLELREFTAGPG